jgi:sec-independent protein translocase protein TatC
MSTAKASSEEPSEKAKTKPEDDVEMTFFEHIGELRKRLIRSLVAMIPGVALGGYFWEELLALIVQPYQRVTARLHLEQELNFTNPTDGFFWSLIIALLAGLIIASPVVFLQVWGFISPGLYRREKRYAIPFVMSSTLLFIGGVAFCYYFVLEPAYEFFLSFSGEISNTGLELNPLITLPEYMELAMRLLLAFGLTFEVPVVITFLSLIGLVNWKQLVRFSRWWLLISAVIAAVLTPADGLTMIAMLIPLNALYWLAILVAFFLGPKPPPPPGSKTEDGFER